MLQIRKTNVYAEWIDNLRDLQGRARILVRVERLASGNPGDVKAISGGVSELRVHFGPGYRIYYITEGDELIILFAGSDKSDQQTVINAARKYLADYRCRQKQ